MTYRLVTLIVAFAASLWVTTASPGAIVSAKPTAEVIGKPVESPASTPKPDMLYATGEGAMASAKEQPNRAKAYLAAKAYAKMQAIANLVQLAKGTIIEYTSHGQNYIADTFIKEQISGVLDSVQVVLVSKRSVEKDIIVAVTVRAPKPLPPTPPPAPVQPSITDVTSSTYVPTWLAAKSDSKCPVPQPGEYTSVIVDAQGLGASRCMSPKILRPDGSEVWGTVKSDYDFVCEHGIVAYARNRSDTCTNVRAGGAPLIVRALRTGDTPSKGDVVISAADAAAIEDANRKTHFLDDYRVIIIVNRVDSFSGMKTNSAKR